MADIVKIDSNNVVSLLHGGLSLGKPFANTIYLVDTHIAGTSYVENIEALEPTLETGKKLKFIREPKNPYDELAIKVTDEEGNKIGYIPKSKNEIMARLMDGGKLLYGTVYEKEFVGEWLKITIQVFLDD